MLNQGPVYTYKNILLITNSKGKLISEGMRPIYRTGS